jgi:hypothetical protein
MVRNNRGGRRGWTTPEQYAWFRRYEPLYLSAQEVGPAALKQLWPQLYEDWFTRWPEPATGSGDLAVAMKAKRTVSLLTSTDTIMETNIA